MVRFVPEIDEDSSINGGESEEWAPYIIGFNNVLYDITRKCTYYGTPDNMVSFTTGYDYVDYTNKDKELEKVYNL